MKQELQNNAKYTTILLHKYFQLLSTILKSKRFKYPQTFAQKIVYTANNFNDMDR